MAADGGVALPLPPATYRPHPAEADFAVRALLSGLAGSSGESLTAPQILHGTRSWDGLLPRQDTRWTFPQIRELRCHPTVVLARAVVCSILMSPSWSVKVAPEREWPESLGLSRAVVSDCEKYVSEYIMGLRPIVQMAIESCIDFGYAPFEKIVSYDARVGVTYISELKSLLPDYTEILVDSTGHFAGLRNTVPGDWVSRMGVGGSGWIDLPPSACVLFNIDKEGQNHYGKSLLANLLGVHAQWKATMKDVAAYNGKVSGNRMIVRYPPGKTEVDGVLVDNRVLAREVGERIQRNLVSIMPHDTSDSLQAALVGGGGGGKTSSWGIEVVAGELSRNPEAYLTLMQYIDGSMVRGVGIPERSVLEAQFGTRADAEQHTDSFLTMLQRRSDWLMYQFNRYITNHMIRENFGPDYEDIVSIEAAPLTDKALAFLRDLYRAYVTGTDRGQIEELPKMDIDIIRDRIGVPTRDDLEEGEENTPDSTAQIEAEFNQILSSLGISS